MELSKKIKKLGKINTSIFRGDINNIINFIESKNSGIFVMNENSMINLWRIDNEDNGFVGGQSINLEKMSGYPSLIELINFMKKKSNCTFFPGTLLRNFGGYVFPTMPIIKNRKILHEKVKQTGIIYADDYSTLAKKFLEEKYLKNILEWKGDFSKKPMKLIHEKLEKEINLRKDKFSMVVDINGLKALPIICNELYLVSDLYRGDHIDIIIHSSDSLNKSNDEMINRYENICRKIRHRLNLPLLIITAEKRDLNNGYEGILSYDGKSIAELN